MPWGGFVDSVEAERMVLNKEARYAKLDAWRVGTANGITTHWEHLEKNQHALGTRCQGKAYAVVESSIRIIGVGDGSTTN